MEKISIKQCWKEAVRKYRNYERDPANGKVNFIHCLIKVYTDKLLDLVVEKAVAHGTEKSWISERSIKDVKKLIEYD